MDEFKRQGGNLTGREERTDSFGGEPRAVGGTLGGHGAKGTTSLTESDTARNGHQHHNNEHLGQTGATGTTGTTGTHGSSHDASHKKPSLMDKLNPKIDSDGDGKAGFMK
jgi:hypothetical protein